MNYKTKTRITIPGEPIAKKRPRFFRRGNHVGTFNSQITEEGKALLLCRDQITGKAEGPLSLSLQFFIPRPKGHYGTGRNAGKIKESAPDHPAKKPDIDNLEKFYLDILNEVAWHDDAQICEINSRKSWAGGMVEPCTIIEISEI